MQCAADPAPGRVSMGRLALVLGACAAVPVLGCDGDRSAAAPARGDPEGLSSIVADQVVVCLRTPSARVHLTAEVAHTPAQRATGLQGRRALEPDAGMLFLYDRLRPPASGFWMFRTRIPLDIAYLGPDGDIRSIRHMQPCPDASPGRCPVYRAGVPYQAALEVNGGFFARHGIQVGDRAVVPGPDCPE